MLKLEKPSDPYSTEWLAYWTANPQERRGIGAEAAETAEESAPAGDDKAAESEKTTENDGDKGKTTVGESDDLTGDDIDAVSSMLSDKDWRADLPDDLKKTAERFASTADAVRAIESFRKRESQVRVPGKDASDEEKAAYRKAVGVPDKPDAYEFHNPEDLEITDDIKASRQAWSARFHELGVPKETAKALSRFVLEDEQNHLKAQLDQDKAFAKQQEDALRSEWKGDEYDKNKTLANRAFKEVAERAGINIEHLTKIETKDGRFLMDRAEIVKLFSVIGREMSEGTLGPTLSESERETVDDQIRDVRKQISEAQNEGDSKRANRLYEKEQSLIAKTRGNKAIVGSHGRAA